MYFLDEVRKECERLQKNFEDLRRSGVSPHGCISNLQDMGGEIDAETASDYFTFIRSSNICMSDVDYLIDGVDKCSFSLSSKRALCASLCEATPRTTTIATIQQMALIRNALYALAPVHRRVGAAPKPISDAMLCYLERAIHILGTQRRNTALLVCAVLAQRGPRDTTREVENQLLSAVDCGWGDAERLAQLVGNRAPLQSAGQATMKRPFVVGSVEGSEFDYMLYPGVDAAHIRMLDGAIAAHEAGASPEVALAELLALDYPISGCFLLRFVCSALWKDSEADPAVQALLHSAPLSALMYVAKSVHQTPNNTCSPVAITSRMDACNSLWDVLSPTCAVDMALFAPGAMATHSPHHPVGGRAFMGRMRATWGHIARVFYAYVQHREHAMSLVAHKGPPCHTIGSSPVKAIYGIPLRRYFTAEEAASMLLSMNLKIVVPLSVYECMMDIVANEEQCELLFTHSFLMNLARIGGAAMGRLCASLSSDDWTAIGDACESVLYFDLGTVRTLDRREALFILAGDAPAWMKRATDPSDNKTAAERLAGMRESLLEWNEWNLDDLLDRLTPTSLAKRAHM